MLGDQQRTRVEHQHPQVRTVTVDFLGAISAKHPRTNDDRIEGDAAIIYSVVPSAANIASEHIDQEFRVLHLDTLIRIRNQPRQITSHSGTLSLDEQKKIC